MLLYQHRLRTKSKEELVQFMGMILDELNRDIENERGSDQKIADHIGVSKQTINGMRANQATQEKNTNKWVTTYQANANSYKLEQIGYICNVALDK